MSLIVQNELLIIFRWPRMTQNATKEKSKLTIQEMNRFVIGQYHCQMSVTPLVHKHIKYLTRMIDRKLLCLLLRCTVVMQVAFLDITWDPLLRTGLDQCA